MKLKELEGHLSAIEPFAAPKYQLEQYPTSAHIAARMVYTMDNSFNDIEDKRILDLGCGTGMLGIGCAIMGAGSVLGVDIDQEALAVALENREEMEVENVDFLLADVSRLQVVGESPVDCVLMNPPFGTRVKSIDVAFLQKAVQLATTAVYSLHKSSTRNHLMKVSKAMGCDMEVLAQLRFDIPQMYEFHKKKSADVEVDFIRLDVSKKKIGASPTS